MRSLFLVALFAFVSVALCAPPDLSEIFSASLQIEVNLNNSKTILSGTGVWVSSQPHGKMLEKFEIADPRHQEENVYRLQRFDLHRAFEILNHGGANSTCHTRRTEGVLPPVWGWLRSAKESTQVLNGVTYRVYNFTQGHATVALAVLPAKPTVPAFLWYHGVGRVTTLKFVTWSTTPPREAHFDVFPTCRPNPGPEDVSCESRSTMISRAQVWVDNKVPYNQGATYQGYREDCSGYVSMAWAASKPGLTTFTLGTISHPISHDELQPGDVLLCRTEHVVLFGGWTDSSHTHYTAFEETRPGEGTVKRVTPYPYWYNTGCFLPYRYNSVC